jgi:hypothetical protein
LNLDMIRFEKSLNRTKCNSSSLAEAPVGIGDVLLDPRQNHGHDVVAHGAGEVIQTGRGGLRSIKPQRKIVEPLQGSRSHRPPPLIAW